MSNTATAPTKQARIAVTVRADQAKHAAQALHTLNFKFHAPSQRWYRFMPDRSAAEELEDRLFVNLGLAAAIEAR